MLNIQRFVCNPLQENCYVVADETRECVVIDCGAFYPEERQAVVQYINDSGLKPVHLLCTHAHIDHNFGNNTLYETFCLQPEVHEADLPLMEKLPMQAEALLGIRLDYEMPPVGRALQETDVVRFGTHVFSIIHTPGHTPGGVFFYCKEEKVAFSGDTLFKGSIGRTDFEGGSMFQIINSLRYIAQLPDDTTVLSGHGERTTIGDELRTNPYMDR